MFPFFLLVFFYFSFFLLIFVFSLLTFEKVKGNARNGRSRHPPTNQPMFSISLSLSCDPKGRNQQ